MGFFLKSIHVVYVVLCVVFVLGFYFFSLKYTNGNGLTNVNGLALFAAIIPVFLFFTVRMIVIANDLAGKYEFYDTVIITIAMLIIILPGLTPSHEIERSCSNKQEERIVITAKLYRNYFFDYFRYFSRSHKEDIMTIGEFCHSYGSFISELKVKNKSIDKAAISEVAFNFSYLSFLESAFYFDKADLSERKASFIRLEE